MKNRIIIEVLGGVASVTASTVSSLEVYLVDWDDIKEGDRRSLKPDNIAEEHK